MRPRRHLDSLASLVMGLLALGLCGCERGCLSSWLSDHGVGGVGPSTPGRGPAPSADPAELTLSAVDCPDGLARCGQGVVQVSRAYHYAVPCKLSPEQCKCPWERLGDCPAAGSASAPACVADGVELDAPRDRALAQLCAPTAPSFWTPAPPDAVVEACDGAFACDKGIVVACAPAPRAVGRCTAGCARDGQTVESDEEVKVSDAAALALLCRR